MAQRQFLQDLVGLSPIVQLYVHAVSVMAGLVAIRASGARPGAGGGGRAAMEACLLSAASFNVLVSMSAMSSDRLQWARGSKSALADHIDDIHIQGWIARAKPTR